MDLTPERKVEVVQESLNELLHYWHDAQLITLDELWMLQASIVRFEWNTKER